jgi:tRNA (guanosine-2'-O-)-methyltransferase
MSDRTRLRAVDRNELDTADGSKRSRWPRTDRRAERVAHVLRQRQPDLTVILEDVHDRHNVSAVLRSCDAVGILDVHALYVSELPPRKKFARTSSGSATKWLRTHRHRTHDACFEAVRSGGAQVLVAALTDEAIDLHDVDFTKPTAVLFGNELHGASDEAISRADHAIYIPMMGMVESLNISVACAVTLYEAQRQRAAVGMYDSPRLSESEIADLTELWLKK